MTEENLVEKAAQRYWAMSQHMRRLPSERDKDAFITFTLMPTIEHTDNPHLKRLLNRLVPRKSEISPPPKSYA